MLCSSKFSDASSVVKYDAIKSAVFRNRPVAMAAGGDEGGHSEMSNWELGAVLIRPFLDGREATYRREVRVAVFNRSINYDTPDFWRDVEQAMATGGFAVQIINARDANAAPAPRAATEPALVVLWDDTSAATIAGPDGFKEALCWVEQNARIGVVCPFPPPAGMLVGLAGICRDIRIAAAVVMTSREQFHPWWQAIKKIPSPMALGFDGAAATDPSQAH